MKSLWGFLILGFTLQIHAYEVIHPGPAQSLGQGQVRSFVRTNTQGEPLSLGFWLQGKALENLPAQEQVVSLALPTGVNIPPYDHLTLDWMVHGHVPDGIYSVPHFDFHFYFVTPEERENVRCDATDTACKKNPDSAYIPPNYVPTPDGIPKMGWHWVDGTSPEFHGQPFTATFIYGFYNGELTFIEPMAALSFLSPKVNFEKDIPQPAKYQRTGYYPSKYSIVYESPLDSYWVVLKNLNFSSATAPADP